MDQVADNVWVGDYQDAQDTEEIKEHSIQTVINLSLRQSVEIDSVRNLHIALQDSSRNEQEQFNQAFQAVLREISKDQNVLVHCNIGVSRSISVTAAAVAERDDRSLRDVLNEIEQKRPVANPHPALIRQAEHVLKGL